MKALISLHNTAFGRLERAEWFLPTLARIVFVAVLFIYFWNAALLKIDGSIFSPSAGAFGQIFPLAAEEALYNVEALTVFQRIVIFAGTMAEFVLPVLILLGLLTRLAALAMIGFIFVQTIVDVTGHGATVGTFFDTGIDLIDERVMWAFLLIVIASKGAGPISLDRLLARTVG